MNVLDLFSGIGGFALGLERAGMRVVAFCEIDRYARAVLARHWPRVPCYGDVRKLTADRLVRDGLGSIDVICGGFPCQDISVAGKGAGLAGARSGLWREFARLVGEVRPRYVIVENTAALLGRGLGEVLGDLAAFGFDAEWHCIPAAAIGAPHIRDRIWIIAHADRNGRWWFESQRRADRRDADVGRNGAQGTARHVASSVADADGGRCESERLAEHCEQSSASGDQPDGCSESGRRDGAQVGDTDGARSQTPERAPILATWWREQGRAIAESDRWAVEPDVGRMAHGIPRRVDRLRCLGSAVLPQFPEMIGRAIMQAEQRA